MTPLLIHPSAFRLHPFLWLTAGKISRETARHFAKDPESLIF